MDLAKKSEITRLQYRDWCFTKCFFIQDSILVTIGLDTSSNHSRPSSYVMLWDTHTWSLIRKCKVSSAPILCAKYNQESNQLAMIDNECGCYIMDMKTFRFYICEKPDTRLFPRTACCFSPDLKHILSVGLDGCAYITSTTPLPQSIFSRYSWIFNILFMILIYVLLFR